MPFPITEWSKLRSTGRPILEKLAFDYESLIQKPSVTESAVHRFIATHAHLMLRDHFNFCTAISKLRFGADYISDFVVIRDNWSAGICYHFIEIERPDSAPFTKEGIASSRLSRAIQQVLSWKSWLDDHGHEARRLFPSSERNPEGRPGFTYEIVIGTRMNSEQWLERRNTLASTLGVSIRSFDSLKDRILRQTGFRDLSSVGDERALSDADRNRLASPFLGAMSDPEWRDLLRKRPLSKHFMHSAGKNLVQTLQESKDANAFRRLIGKRPVSVRKPIRTEQQNLKFVPSGSE